ncbi:MAG: VacJ family lipoprotein [Gammaproteobacteria bacterium]|nr:VacJ family lipoprotein [Gammaproteobacteria bacterium]MBT8111619.1 VacJ family lipoprotein [Gammaproteobacteria bacterium]NNL46317.1 VacJ family lipoprotein [Woeseiaceae bacterium]
MRVATAANVVLLAALLGACASIPEEQRTDSDPWEPLNRTLYSVNTAVDTVSLKPLAKGYDKVMPRPVRNSVSHFMDNLVTPASALNNFLQWKPAYGFTELARFVFNSTLGIAGLFDVATTGGIEARREDFGQTAAVWGVPPGPYVMLPLLGPSTLRDALMRPLDILSNPLYHYEVTSVRDKLTVLRIIDLRYRLLAVDKLLEGSKDKYITTRESYLQNRRYEVYDGYPPEDDAFLDEFLEDEVSDEGAGN